MLKGALGECLRGLAMVKVSVWAAGWFSRSTLICICLLPLVGSQLYAKTAGLSAIEIYPGQNGQAYAQISDFILNEKNEVYLCGGASSIDKNAYHKLAKVALTAGMSLERNASGVLSLTQQSGSDCVVPGNFKFDKGDAYTTAQLADKAEMTGAILPASDPATTQIPLLKAGVKIVFVAAPDQELAEYLRADREADIHGWQVYLGKYAAGSHLVAAKKALAGLYLNVATADRQAYEASKAGTDPDYNKLMDARQMVDKALALVSDDATAADLNQKIHAEVIAQSKLAIDKLSLYNQALKQQTAGYANLVAAEKLANGASSVEPATAEAMSAKSQTLAARALFDKTLRDTESQISAHHPDLAAQTVDPLRAFAQEDRKIADDLEVIAGLYVADAKQLEQQPDWPGAVAELEKASATATSPETTALLKEARKQAKITADKAAALAAAQKSQDAQSRNDVIAAYEVLDDLPSDQHALVTAQLDSLKDQYVQTAEQTATALQKAHDPINGISDESGIQTAYGYLQRCYRLTNDPGLQDRISILGDDLSNYYLQQGKKYVEKPDGTGVNVGWTYLSEALQYKSQSNLSAIHDEMTTARAAYLLKSRLSVKVVFRDQTSRRDAGNFPAQLTDALATGLESSGLDVKVLRQQDATPVQPNFQLVGDVLQHEMLKSQDIVPKESKYRFGQQEIPNEAWAEANREYEHANNDLESARSILQGAQARGKKNEIKDAQKVVDDDTKTVEDLHEKLDLIPKTKLQDEERPYTYTQVVYHLRIALQVQFQILDSTGEEVEQRVAVSRETPREYSILENVKPEDTQGVQNVGVVPNDNDFFEEDENKTRDELIDKAKAKAAELPGIVLSRADHKAADGDNDGAAELYILYLNATPSADTPERTKARSFLASQFNFKEIGRDVSSN
jgi:hypothetical protein